MRDAMRKDRFTRKNVIATGIDLYSEEALAKQAARSQRFGMAQPEAVPGIAIAAPDPEEEARKKRAEKFGLSYEAKKAEGCIPEIYDLWIFLLTASEHSDVWTTKGRLTVLSHDHTCRVELRTHPRQSQSLLHCRFG
jgi:hypothetical protein